MVAVNIFVNQQGRQPCNVFVILDISYKVMGKDVLTVSMFCVIGKLNLFPSVSQSDIFSTNGLTNTAKYLSVWCHNVTLNTE